jgi:hypothetical protein
LDQRGIRDLPNWKLFISKLKLKSRILANKKYLLNDPVVKGMNDTQWLWEFEAYAQSQEARYDEYRVVMDAWKSMLVGLLGLNLMPVEEEEGGRLRMPTQDEIMPLALIMGREEVVSTISKRLEDFKSQGEVDYQEGSGESISVEDIEEAFPDMMILEDANELKNFKFLNDPAIKKIQEAWVLPLDKKDEDIVKSNKEERKPKKSRLRIEK